MSLIAYWGSKKKRPASGGTKEISRSKFKTAVFVAFANLVVLKHVCLSWLPAADDSVKAINESKAFNAALKCAAPSEKPRQA
jgi:hypothetical protein